MYLLRRASRVSGIADLTAVNILAAHDRYNNTTLLEDAENGKPKLCQSCHGSTHAVYGAINKYGMHRDNMQPIQYQGVGGTIGTADNCEICHTIEMKFNGHHRNMVNRSSVPFVVE